MNFGWPCKEGPETSEQFTIDPIGKIYKKEFCDPILSQNLAFSPFFLYKHSNDIDPTHPCPTGSSSVSAIAFLDNTHFPEPFKVIY